MLQQDRRPKALQFIQTIQHQARTLAGIEIPVEEILARVRAHQYACAMDLITKQAKGMDEEVLFEISQEIERIVEEQGAKQSNIRSEGQKRR